MAGSEPRTIWHVVDWRSCGPVVAWSIAALRANPSEGFEHKVALIGTARDGAAAERWLAGGVQRATTSGVRAMARVAGRDTGSGGAVVGWSRGILLELVRQCRGVAVGGLLVSPAEPGPGERLSGTAWFDGLIRQGRVAFASNWARDAGTRADRSNCPVMPLPMPMLDGSFASTDRSWFHLHDADERFTLAAVGWPGRAACATRASYTAGVLAIGGHCSAAAVPSDAEDLERATRFAHRHDDAWPVFAVDASDPRLCAAADVALWCGHAGAMLAAAGRLPPGVLSKRPAPLAESLLLPLALGIPIVSESVPATRELLGTGVDSGDCAGAGWLTGVGDRLAMNRAAYQVLLDPDGTRMEQRRMSEPIRATRDPMRFARVFDEWLRSWADEG